MSGYGDLLIAFGARVRLVRLERRLSQEALAHEAGLDRTYIGLVERGKRNASLVNVCRLARALKTSPASLLEGIGCEERQGQGSSG